MRNPMRISVLSIILVAFTIAILCPTLFAQNTDDNQKRTDSTSIVAPDSLLAAPGHPGPDSARAADSLGNLEHYKLLDSVKTGFLSERLNLREASLQGFQHDAADFLRSAPSNLIVDYQITPLRKNVYPFTLPGGRKNVVLGSRPLSPFEHLPEPDNMIDFNDIPTAPVQNAYDIDGPLGMVFGGENAASTLLLVPHDPATTRAESKMVVDKGTFGYAYTKALFTHRNAAGRSIKLALGYRKSNGTTLYRNDDAYHQWGEIIYPLGKKVRLNLNGRLYKREGDFPFRPEISAFYLNRFRRDRDLSAGLEIGGTSKGTGLIEFGRQYSKSKISRTGISYFRNLDTYNNYLTMSYDRQLDGYGFRVNSTAKQETFTESGDTKKRYRGQVDISLLKRQNHSSILTYLKMEKVESFPASPSAAVIYSKNNALFSFSASVGYSTKFPRLYELNLSAKSGRILTSDAGPDYFECGNPSLTEEKQLAGNITLGLGKVGSDFILSLTGGKIFKGIDWRKFDTLNYEFGAFKATNRDIEFASLTAKQRIAWRDFLHWQGGAAYHYLAVDKGRDSLYAPDYQGFSQLEMHLYINKLDLHLYAFGEGIYNGPYYGYDGAELGDNFIAHVRLSFRIKSFRFYYIFQDVLNLQYEPREDYLIWGRANYYGLTWEFLD
jgi:hypothetical protein